MKTTRLISAAVFALLISVALPSAQAFIVINLPGTSEYEGWADLNAFNYSGVTGGFPGLTPWSSSIASNQGGSAGNASFNKVSGGGYAATTSIYTFDTPGTFEVTNNTPVTNLESVVFQVDMGGSVFGSTPILNYNGGSQALAADFTALTAGTVVLPPGPGGPGGPSNNYAFQWDLSGLPTITSYEIEWTTDEHESIVAIQLDSSDTHTQVVPEPSTFLLLVLGSASLFLRRRRTIH